MPDHSTSFVLNLVLARNILYRAKQLKNNIPNKYCYTDCGGPIHVLVLQKVQYQPPKQKLRKSLDRKTAKLHHTLHTTIC